MNICENRNINGDGGSNVLVNNEFAPKTSNYFDLIIFCRRNMPTNADFKILVFERFLKIYSQSSGAKTKQFNKIAGDGEEIAL